LIDDFQGPMMAMNSNLAAFGNILNKLPGLQNHQNQPVPAVDDRLNDLKYAREKAETTIAVNKAREHALITATTSAAVSEDIVLIGRAKEKAKILSEKAMDDFDSLI
jgi:hypothetical protein